MLTALFNLELDSQASTKPHVHYHDLHAYFQAPALDALGFDDTFKQTLLTPSGLAYWEEAQLQWQTPHAALWDPISLLEESKIDENTIERVRRAGSRIKPLAL